jgi:RNA polymerase sigma factor (sigma-70 family)
MWLPCVRLARRVVGDSDAEDVAVEAFARALERWRTVGELTYLDPWILRVTANISLDRLRRMRRSAAIAQVDPQSDDTAALRITLQQALRRLPKRQREVIVLRYLADLSEPDVAAALGISLGSVKTHARRGINALRLHFGDNHEAILHA